MPDLLVKLYELPTIPSIAGVTIRRALAPERHVVLDWVARFFYPAWRSECAVAFSQSPISCIIAVEGQKLLGFACYDTTTRNFFGPTGVDPDCRGRGVGTALLVAALDAMKQLGYGYAIVGDAGPVEFYQRTVGAIVIPDSTPGVYRGMLQGDA